MPFDDPLDKEKGEEYGFKPKKILHSKYKKLVLELSKQQKVECGRFTRKVEHGRLKKKVEHGKFTENVENFDLK
jgi:primosomal protein N''